MGAIPVEHGLILASVLFVIGLIGVLTRRNVVFVLMSLEIMLNASALAFIVAASRWEQADGQVMFIMILTLAAAEVAVGLGLILQMFLQKIMLEVTEEKHIDVEDWIEKQVTKWSKKSNFLDEITGTKSRKDKRNEFIKKGIKKFK